MKLKPSPALVKSSLSAHSVVGLVIGYLMYLVCLTGALVVYKDVIQRWEQPDVAEFSEFDSTTVETALNDYLSRQEQSPESLYVVLPTDHERRMHLSDGEAEWLLREDGTLGAEPREGLAHLLVELHYYLHLPSNIGILLVSALGAMLLGLIISGLLAHPRIFKDAFRFRLGGSRRLEQADIHNRLSVWGLPFHLMIALTGAFFGLAGLLVLTAAPAYYGGDREALIADIYGGDPVVEAPVQKVDVAAALAELQQRAPEAEPIYLVVQKPNTSGQFLEIAASLPGRLVYSEIYRYDADGIYINHQGLSDGIAGRQILYSVYRIHFGHFGGEGTTFWVKLAYLLLGLALTVVSVTGVNVWLARRGGRDWVNDFWCAGVWGTPAAIAMAALGAVVGNFSLIGFFLAGLVACLGLSLWLRDETRSAMLLKWGSAILLLLLVAVHGLIYPAQVGQGPVLAVHTVALLLAAWFVWAGYRQAAGIKAAEASRGGLAV
ncbi:PepSY-associated TM helix domain-containing protein [Microbulbifer taiwanensis]|uniref:PepSY-associated TM helix domain-containing protein n=1 Tax=Microbulbifer taiwanensis TaxID=986746 RepID=A0ABW1YJR2_9GAMM|nr:PepSY-associated TM helix domain-containing protein [Microbulbifer taiwanensis]